MLQLIGWLGCLYLVVKALEIGSSSQFRSAEGSLKTAAMVALIIAWLGAIIFAMAFSEQAATVRPILDGSGLR